MTGSDRPGSAMVQACRALWAAGARHEIERRVDATLRLDVGPARGCPGPITPRRTSSASRGGTRLVSGDWPPSM